MKKYIARALLFFLDDLPTGEMTKEQEYGLLSQLYQNDSFRKYLKEREEYLIKNGMERFIEGKLQETHGFAGQIVEVNTMLHRCKAAYNYMQKSRTDRVQG